MASAEEIVALHKDICVNSPGVVWVSASGKKTRVPFVRQCPGCKAHYRLKGGQQGEHYCRILHCNCPTEFCWFCMASVPGRDYNKLPCVPGNNILEACPYPVKPNV